MPFFSANNQGELISAQMYQYMEADGHA